jgi:H+/Cl- antiporter ClcA
MVVKVAPATVGSGIPELISMMNGVNFTDLLTAKALICKVIGLVFVTLSSLCVGKEGPLVHIGAICATLVLFLPFRSMQQFQTETKKREFLTAGISAGVSVAFGAPIGGTLFAYEISSTNSFWSFNLLWKNFFCAATSTLVLQVLTSIKDGVPITLSDIGILKFGFA